MKNTTSTLITSTLIYVHDPMCSWCWSFRPVWQSVKKELSDDIEIQYLLGGLAPDSQALMPKDMQQSIRNTWQRIQQEVPGTEFNYAFWEKCQPRRSTYPACRAIIACRMQQPSLEKTMLLAIQHAYYLNAQNPSDEKVLVNLAEQIGLDAKQFAVDIRSEDCQNDLLQEIKHCRDIGVSSFPGLVLKKGESYTLLDLDYNSSKTILDQIK